MNPGLKVFYAIANYHMQRFLYVWEIHERLKNVIIASYVYMWVKIMCPFDIVVKNRALIVED